jgi:hypothetical protein
LKHTLKIKILKEKHRQKLIKNKKWLIKVKKKLKKTDILLKYKKDEIFNELIDFNISLYIKNQFKL